MSDDALIRRGKLKSLMAARTWEIKDLGANLGWGRYSFWKDLVEDPNKSFGEKVARRIEEAAGIPRGWLDAPGGSIPAALPVMTEAILPLRDDEPDLLAGFRLLDPADRETILSTVAHMVMTKHDPTIAVMTRLKVHVRADDAKVIEALAGVPKPPPPQRKSATRHEDGPPTKKKTPARKVRS